ncbi:FAD-dependent monooxygenase [Nocardia sp. XZ_19_385]|uniref:FAD-dependent monooxygenase n=1 Tax=Nocardia sp. XZ_19_385 TaxID=2769488 RepID=UPI00281622AE|nr:FAD-dependent monooxygenase [Nocardia sp. XZ_19_385]
MASERRAGVSSGSTVTPTSVGQHPFTSPADRPTVQANKRWLDRLVEGANTSRAAVVHARTLEVLEEIGLADELIGRGIVVPTWTRLPSTRQPRTSSRSSTSAAPAGT